MAHPFFDVPVPTVIGHRGCAGERPENTLPSFQRALEQGAAVLESDLHLTRDGVPVLFHDDDVARTTEGSGPVAALALAELQALDAGYRFSPDGGRSFPARGTGVRVPSLEQALRALPGARFNLELKAADPALADRTLALLREHGREERTLLTAGDDAIMAGLRRALRASGARVAQGACTGDVAELIAAAQEGRAPRSEAMAYQVPAAFAGQPLVTRPFVDCAHAHGRLVHVWTVNEPGETTRLRDLGVDGLVTDFPGRLAAWLAAPGAPPAA